MATTTENAQVPDELRRAWAAKKDVIISHDATRIDLHGGKGKRWRWPTHLTEHELVSATDTFVVSLLNDKVTSINVASCAKLTDESMKAIAKGCPELKELNVGRCKNLTDESMKAIAKGCPELKELNVFHINNLTNESMKAIAKGCPELKVLNVSVEYMGNSNLTDESMKAIAKGCPELKELNVGGIENLTDSSMKAIAEGCPELKELNVGGIENLTDSSMKAIAKGCPELKVLNVSRCRISMEAISQGCPRLELLEACDCGLASLPSDFFERLALLTSLDLWRNSLRELPHSILKHKHLRRLDVKGNPLQSPPYEIATQGLDAIKRYFSELEKGSSVSKLLKVVLVGDGEAGKTSLRNALAGRPNPRQEDRTIHLDIEKITLNADLDINVYDCGGQEEYLATQLPYLTGLALYIVLVEAQYATDEYAHVVEDKLHRFLVVLQNRVPGAVVLPIVTKVDTVEDPERRCLWLESKIEEWLQDMREAVCCDLPDSSSDRPPPLALLDSVAHACGTPTAGNIDKPIFIPLRVQSPALAVSVANEWSVGDVRDSVRAVRDRIIALTKHKPPLLRGVGQQIPSTYVAVLNFFGAIAEYGDNDLALEALRDERAHALGETSELSPGGTYRPKDELEQVWNTYRDESDGNEHSKTFDDATQLWEAQGLIFVDAGLVVLQPEFLTTIVKPLVDHRYNDQLEYEQIDDAVVQFLKSTSACGIDTYSRLVKALTTFRASGEVDCSEESLCLAFLWRDTGLDRSHYVQVLQMLATSGVILEVERDAGERRPVVVVPFRLPKKPDETKIETFWPKFLPWKERELKLRFEPMPAFPTGLAERFVADVHGLGTSLYCWRSGVVVKDRSGYGVLAKRSENVLHFSVRFEAHSSEKADAAWKALCDAQRILAAQRENRFPGLFYKECFLCEECCREGKRRVATKIFDAKRRKCVFTACGHCFDLDSKGICHDSSVKYFHARVSRARLSRARFVGAAVGGDANYHIKVQHSVVKELEEHSNSDMHQTALETQGKSPEATAQHAKKYVKSLEHTDANVRRAAVETLGKLPDAMALHIEAIVQRLEDSDSTVRQAVVRAFMSLDDVVATAGAIAPLVRLVRSGTNGAKEAAAAALGCLPVNADNQALMPGAIPPLVELVRVGTNREKQEAATVLSKLAEFNTSIRATIASAGGILPLVKLAIYGTDVAREKAASTLWSLAGNVYSKIAKARAGATPSFVDQTTSGREAADWVLGDDAFLAVLALMSGNMSAFAHNHPSILRHLEIVTVAIVRQLENAVTDKLQLLMLEKSRAHLRKAALKNGFVPWRRIKLMIVGPGRAGKTCLLRRLITGATPVRNEPSTIGVEMYDLHEWCEIKVVGQEHLFGMSALLDPGDGSPGVSCSRQDHLSDHEMPSSAPKIAENFETQLVGPQREIISTDTSPLDRNQPHHSAFEKTRQDPGRNFEELFSPLRTEKHSFETTKTAPDIKDTVIKNVPAGIRMRVWDCGGQEVFHGVLTQFLTGNGIYIVVFNMVDLHSEGQEKTRALGNLELWFQSIALHAPGAPVFAVGTHRQSVPKADLQSMSRELETIAAKAKLKLQSPVPNEAFYAVDTTEDPSDAEVYGKLRKAIERSVLCDANKYVHTKLPLAWLQTYDELQCARTAKRMYYTDVSSVANLLQRIYDHRAAGNHRVFYDEINDMLNRFAELGIILHFGTAFGSQCGHLVFVDPQWLLDMFAVIIRDLRWHPMRCDMEAWTGQAFQGNKIYDAGLGTAMWEAYSQHGILYSRLLDLLWPLNEFQVGDYQVGDYHRKKTAKQHIRSMLLAVMESLKLIVKLPPADQDRYLVPSILPIGTVSSAASYTSPGSNRIVLNFLPLGLFSRILAMLVACRDLRADPRLIYRSAARFGFNGTFSLSVYEHRLENAIYISPSGNEGKKIVVDAVNELSRLFYSNELDIVDEQVVKSLPSHLDDVDIDAPVPMLMGTVGENGGKPNASSHKGEFDELAGQIEAKIQQEELICLLTDHLQYDKYKAKRLVGIFSKRHYHSIEDVSCLDDTAWEKLGTDGRLLTSKDKRKIRKYLRSFKRPAAKKLAFAVYVADSDETCKRLQIELEGLLTGFTLGIDLSRPPVNVIMKQVDEWNGLVLAGRLDDWLNAQQPSEDVVVHVAFHGCREAIDAEDGITKVPSSNLPKRNHALVLNACATYRSQDHDGAKKFSRWVIAWEGEVDAKTLRFFNEGFYAKFVNDYPKDDALKSYIDEFEKKAPYHRFSNHRFVKSFACGIHQICMRSREARATAVLMCGGLEILRLAPAPASRIPRGDSAHIKASCCDDGEYAELFFDLGPLEEKTHGEGPSPVAVPEMRSDEEPVLCVITTRRNEYRAVRRRLRPAIRRGDSVIKMELEGVSMLVGRLGEYPAALFQTHMRDSGTEKALEKIIPQLPSIRVVVAIGFGYGLDPALKRAPECGQMIGDVMVSAQCVDYTHFRASNDGNYSRGEIKSLNNDIAMALTEVEFEAWASGLKWEDNRRPRPPCVHYGPYLSGLTLIDDPVQNHRFKKGAGHLNPIGGDMELFQIVKAVCDCGRKIYWLAIKGISDFAGADQIPKTKNGQELAAATATDFACYIFSRTKLLSSVLENPVRAGDSRRSHKEKLRERDYGGCEKHTYENSAGFKKSKKT